MIPDYIDPEAWAGFVAMRKAIKRHPWTPRAELLILRDLAEIHAKGHDVNAALDQSTLCGWRGVWPAKDRCIERAPETAQQYAKRQREEAAAERSRAAPMPAEVRAKLAQIRRVA